jgi:LuxR family maltose regulon positive regulatory protein
MRCAANWCTTSRAKPTRNWCSKNWSGNRCSWWRSTTRREWFRFHHLFRDLLRFRLRAEDPSGPRRACWAGRPTGTSVRGEVGRRGRVPHCGPRDWNRTHSRSFMARGSEVFERGRDGDGHRVDPEDVPESARSGTTGRQPPPRRPPGQPRVRRPGAEDVLRRVVADPGASAGRAGVRPMSSLAALAQWRPNVPTRHHRLRPLRALDMLGGVDDAELPERDEHLSDQASRSRPWPSSSGGRAHFLAGAHRSQAREWLERGPADIGGCGLLGLAGPAAWAR